MRKTDNLLMIPATLFFISCTGIVVMIALKARRLRLDVRSRFSFVSARVDTKIRKAYGKIRVFFSYINRKSAVALLHFLAYHMFVFLRNVYGWIYRKLHAHPHSKRVINMVQGKGETEKTGGASFYLKRISEEQVR